MIQRAVCATETAACISSARSHVIRCVRAAGYVQTQLVRMTQGRAVWLFFGGPEVARILGTVIVERRLAIHKLMVTSSNNPNVMPTHCVSAAPVHPRGHHLPVGRGPHILQKSRSRCKKFSPYSDLTPCCLCTPAVFDARPTAP